MYIAPGQGQTTPWGQMLMSTESPYHFAHLLQVLKQSLLKYDFKSILNDFIHVYSPRAGTDDPLVTKFWCRQKLSLYPFVASLKKKSLWSLIFMYIAPGRGTQPIGDKKIMTTERPFLFAHMLQLSKWSLGNLILFTSLAHLSRFKAHKVSL